MLQLSADFNVMLNRLLDFPDKTIIFDITKFAELHVVDFAASIAERIVLRIVDPNTNPTYKLPTFYLIDSIMKHVGGPYAALFSRYLGEAFIHAHNEVVILF